MIGGGVLTGTHAQVVDVRLGLLVRVRTLVHHGDFVGHIRTHLINQQGLLL